LPTKIVHEGGGASGEEHRAIGLILPDDFQKLAEGKLILKDIYLLFRLPLMSYLHPLCWRQDLKQHFCFLLGNFLRRHNATFHNS
jgi:hypothetical protein